MATVRFGSFEWDSDKNEANFAKHGIRFEEAVRVFDDITLTRIDARFPYGETREISIGSLAGDLILTVVHTDRQGNTRLISARRANKQERGDYRAYIETAFGRT